ncbi:hypothetical protein MMC10_004428 [Thelotrema lepadinum]|nr:hypothetical protein [Thelotrema lepadinum]
MPKNGRTKSNLVTGNMIHSYLQKYAEDHDLLSRIRFNAVVRNVERGGSRGWQLTIDKSSDIIEAEKVLVATGVTSIPHMPEDFDTSPASIPIVHSKDLGTSYQSLQSEKVENVVVVGAAKSAYDAVYLLVSMGKKVTWCIRPDGAGPLAILPTNILGVMNCIAVASTRLMTYLSPSIFNTSGLLYQFFQKSSLGQLFTSTFWNFLDYTSHRHAGYDAGDHITALKPEVNNKSTFWANSGLGVITLPDFWARLHSGNITIIRDSLSNIKEDKVLLKGGQTLSADFMVLCTGWGDHFGMFDNDTKAELGLPIYGELPPSVARADVAWEKFDIEAEKSVNQKLPFLATAPQLRNSSNSTVKSQRRWRLYRRSIPLSLALKDDRSIAILGQIHTVQTPLVSEIQSFWTILYLLREIDLPDEETMVREIAEWNTWTRKRYLTQGQKFPYSLYEFLPYVDTLCRDLGINCNRKSNFLAELFEPYRPEDFNGFVDEWLAKREAHLV